MKDLLAWAQAEGASFPKLAYPVLFPPGYIGSQATADILPNEAIVTIPRRLLFIATLADESPFGHLMSKHPELFDPGEHSWSEDFRLIALLLYELRKGADSFWYPFLESLPRDVDTLMKWSSAELEELQDGILTNDVQQKACEAEACWQQLRSVLLEDAACFSPEMLTFDLFSWANDIVCTRAFGTSTGSNALSPVAELLNHNAVHTYHLYGPVDRVKPRVLSEDDGDSLPYDSASVWPVSYRILARLVAMTEGLAEDTAQQLLSTATLYDDERYARLQAVSWKPVEFEDTHDFVFRILTGPTETYSAGAELYLCYGAESNRHLLLHYGFSLPVDCYNYEYIFVAASELMTEQQKACADANDLGEVWCFKVREREICMQMVRTVRALLWRKTVHSPEAAFLPRDWALEQRTLEICVEILRSSLELYPTTVSQDEALLGSAASPRLLFALRYRTQRKRALHTQISLLTTLLSALPLLKTDTTSHFRALDYPPLQLTFEGMLQPYLREVA